MDASAEFQVFLAPTSKWRERTQGITQRLVPVITNMIPSNGFSLNNRSPNVYKAVSGVSFQDTDLRGRKKKNSFLTKKEQLGEKKSESEPSIFRSKKEQFTLSQLYKKKETDESNHKRSNSTKRKPSFEFRHKDLVTIPISTNMEPNKIAKTSSKKERSRSSSQVRIPLPLSDKTNSFEFPIRPRRTRSSSRSRNSTGQLCNSYEDDKKKKTNSDKYCSFTPWKNIDVIRNVEELRITKTMTSQTNTEENMSTLSSDITEQINTLNSSIHNEDKNKTTIDSVIHVDETILYDNLRENPYEECFEADSSSEIIYVSQTLEVDRSELTVQIVPESRIYHSHQNITTSNDDMEDLDENIYDYIDLPETPEINQTINIEISNNSDTENKNKETQTTHICCNANSNLYQPDKDQERVWPKKYEVSIVNITSDNNDIVQPIDIDLEDTQRNLEILKSSLEVTQQNITFMKSNLVEEPTHTHKILTNQLSNDSILSKDSSDYDYVVEYQNNIDHSDEDEDTSMYSTFIPNSEVENSSKPLIPRVHLSSESEQSMRLRVNGEFVDVTQTINEHRRASDSRLLPLNPIMRLSDQQLAVDSKSRRHSWLNSFISKDQFDRDQENEHWSSSSNSVNKKGKNNSSSNESINSRSSKPDVIKASLDYTNGITTDDETQLSTYPEPLYEPIIIKPLKKEIKIPRVVSKNGIVPPKTFKDFLENRCFNPIDSDTENIYSDRTSDMEENLYNIYNNRKNSTSHNKAKQINKTFSTDDESSLSWLEASSEFEFVDLRDDSDDDTDDDDDDLPDSSDHIHNICVKVPSHLNSKPNKDHQVSQSGDPSSTYPTLSSLPAAYTPHCLAPSSSAITL